jgi:hypothetical protein
MDLSRVQGDPLCFFISVKASRRGRTTEHCIMARSAVWAQVRVEAELKGEELESGRLTQGGSQWLSRIHQRHPEQEGMNKGETPT